MSAIILSHLFILESLHSYAYYSTALSPQPAIFTVSESEKRRPMKDEVKFKYSKRLSEGKL